MNISTINWWAVIVAALSNFLIGALWYSPALFGKQCRKENNLTEDELKKGNLFPSILTLLFSVIMAFNLAMFLNDPNTTPSWGAIAGFLAGFGWASLALCIIALFERKSKRYMFIHSGYITISFVIMGLILGAWR
jgi:Protein of unknown function (DUF1761)